VKLVWFPSFVYPLVIGIFFFAFFPLDSSVFELSPAAVNQLPLAGRILQILQILRQFQGVMNNRTLTSFSETPAASKSSFIIEPLYSTKLVMVDVPLVSLCSTCQREKV
jgi:hypothetical protein